MGNHEWFLLEEFGNALIADTLLFGLLLQTFHTAPTMFRASWMLILMNFFSWVSPFYKALKNIDIEFHFYLEKGVVTFLYLCASIAQKFMPPINPHVSEKGLLAGKNITREDKFDYYYEVRTKGSRKTPSSIQSRRANKKRKGGCC